jgi:hypothetical protein
MSAAAARLAPHSGSSSRFEARIATRDAPSVKYVVLGLGLAFFAFFLMLPVISAFFEALRKGWVTYFSALVEPDAFSAIRLALLAAAIAVPFNLVSGVSAPWATAKFDFRGKQLLITHIDIADEAVGHVNEFRWRVEGAFVRVGDDLLPPSRTDLADGAPVIAFARPHDTEIVLDGTAGTGITAEANRSLGSGAVFRVELVTNGARRKGRLDYFEVELTNAELHALNPIAVKRVRINSRRLSDFGENS